MYKKAEASVAVGGLFLDERTQRPTPGEVHLPTLPQLMHDTPEQVSRLKPHIMTIQ